MASDSQAHINRVVLASCEATRQLGDHLLAEAVQEAPLEGTLRASGHVVYLVNGSEIEDFGLAVTAALAAARTGALRSFQVEVRFSEVYAARQHEETTWQHPRAGKAKFLEDPVKRNAGRYERVLANAVGPLFRGGAGGANTAVQRLLASRGLTEDTHYVDTLGRVRRRGS